MAKRVAAIIQKQAIINFECANVMNQFSGDGSPVQLQVISGQLLFIDPGYFDEIAAAQVQIGSFSKTDAKKWLEQVEKEVFPYGGGSLLGIMELPDNGPFYELDIARVTSYDEDEPHGEAIEQMARDKSITAFGIDTGSFLIIDWACWDALLPTLCADDLFDLVHNPECGYIEKVNGAIGNHGWAFVASPGIKSGIDFIGDGSYYIKD